MDNLTKEQRHLCMSRIRSKNTHPEIVVKKVLRSLRQKYRSYIDALPGTPDIIVPKKRTAIFINGCFWHQHKGCKRKAMPKVNLRYWKNKLKNNVQRQKNDIIALRKNGWKAIIVWECEAKTSNKLVQRLKKVLIS